ncbi:FAD-dependent oxidoreductase [Ruania halotolerans]|uniref:FAD-dependent oxidoreductase n=1 Tax=Ruania halotolerans TaxID=2897773 RepID=UPI001E358E69|nr:FAD-dependent oxidoreductase [Ruania halotolerans]UFU08167.1 FAD-dependent oxidoreductase [Ruania halotolerans]
MTDVLVFGATSAGVCAAVAAARAGARVVLAEPGQHVGGMTTGGLGYTDVGDVRALGGPAARFRQAIADHYDVPVGHFAGPEPHVAEQIFTQWLEQVGVEVRFGRRLAAVTTTGGAITEVTFDLASTHLVTHLGTRAAQGSEQVRPAVVIDASYEGDLLAAAGVSYAVGRDAVSTYGEAHAGRQELLPGRHTMPAWISPFAEDLTGRIEGALLPQIKAEPMVGVGESDGGVMAYGYRVCLSTAADRVPFTPSPGYDEAHWELYRRVLAHWEAHGGTPPAGKLLGLEPNLPGGMADGNSLGPISLNVLDGSAWEYPDATAQRREEIRTHHLQHTSDFLYFLSNAASVPAQVRTELQRWGLPAGEFTDTDHLPHQLYVREARRMLGEYVLTAHDLLQARPVEDVIALGSYHLDVREVQRTWRWAYEHPDPVAMTVTEGYLSVGVPVYPIPYRSLVPRRSECTNLIAAVCLSASHLAFSSVRMEPQYQMLGEAAGLAAAAAARDAVAVQDVAVPALQEQLRAAGAVLAR